jgi:hypothetical protein
MEQYPQSSLDRKNKKGKVRPISQEDYHLSNKCIPIIGYHDIDKNKTSSSTDVSLFYAEMKYLHDSGFKVLTMADLGYDDNAKTLYIKKNIPN